MTKYTDADLTRLFEEGIAKGAEWLFVVGRPGEGDTVNECHYYVMPGEDFIEVSDAALNEGRPTNLGVVYSLLETKEKQDQEGANDLAYFLLWSEWMREGKPETLEWQERFAPFY